VSGLDNTIQTIYGSIAVAQRIAVELWRRKVGLLCWTLFPISILMTNGLTLAEQSKLSLGKAFNQSIPPSLMGAALFFSCFGGSIATLVAEQEKGTLRRLLVSPLSGLAYCTGIYLAYGAIGIGQMLLVYGIAAFMGADLKGNLLLELLVVLLGMATYVSAGFTVGAKFARRTEDVNALIAAFGVPLLMLSGAFVPIEFFPKILQNAANFNPIYHMIEALADILQRNKGLTDHFWVLVGWASLMLGGGWFSYNQLLGSERSR
jgi:ABC-2 type transport system permease protein